MNITIKKVEIPSPYKMIEEQRNRKMLRVEATIQEMVDKMQTAIVKENSISIGVYVDLDIRDIVKNRFFEAGWNMVHDHNLSTTLVAI